MRLNHHCCWDGSLVSGSESNEPAFENCCGHAPEEFVGSCEYWARGPHPTRIDVYMHGVEQEVCIRTSDKGHEYRTCGTLCDLIHRCGAHNDPMHRAALQLIDARYDIRATRKTGEQEC